MTLGAHEVGDLAAAVAHLRAAQPYAAIGLWGRSMGAVTALLYSQRDPSIAGVVRRAAQFPSLAMDIASACCTPRHWHGTVFVFAFSARFQMVEIAAPSNHGFDLHAEAAHALGVCTPLVSKSHLPSSVASGAGQPVCAPARPAGGAGGGAEAAHPARVHAHGAVHDEALRAPPRRLQHRRRVAAGCRAAGALALDHILCSRGRV